MDIGGTLTKIVYFQANMNSASDISSITPSVTRQTTISSEIIDGDSHDDQFTITTGGLRKNRSFVNLEEPEQKAALQELYEYIDLEKELAVRDDKLSFNSHILGGQIHFLHFETR